VFETIFHHWLVCSRIGEFFTLLQENEEYFSAITENIVFVSPHWEEIRLNLVSTDSLCTQCPVLCLTSQAHLFVMVTIGNMCVLCAAKAAVMPAKSGFITWYTLERNAICVSFVEKDLLLAVNSWNMGLHVLERSRTCACRVARDIYSVEIYGDTYWLTQVRNLSVAHTVVRGLQIIEIKSNISLYMQGRNCINVTNVGKVSTILEFLKLITWLILVKNHTNVKSVLLALVHLVI